MKFMASRTTIVPNIAITNYAPLSILDYCY